MHRRTCPDRQAPQSALAIFVCLNIIQFVIGSYIEPRVAGSVLAISPFVVLFSVFLWTLGMGPVWCLHRRANRNCGSHIVCAASI